MKEVRPVPLPAAVPESDPVSEAEMMDISVASGVDITLDSTLLANGPLDIALMEASYKGDPLVTKVRLK